MALRLSRVWRRRWVHSTRLDVLFLMVAGGRSGAVLGAAQSPSRRLCLPFFRCGAIVCALRWMVCECVLCCVLCGCVQCGVRGAVTFSAAVNVCVCVCVCPVCLCSVILHIPSAVTVRLCQLFTAHYSRVCPASVTRYFCRLNGFLFCFFVSRCSLSLSLSLFSPWQPVGA